MIRIAAMSIYNRHHPLLILMYHSNMLSPKEVALIAKSTRYRWNNFNHEDYYGHELALDYIKQFDNIKEVYSKRQLYKTVKLMVELSKGYNSIMDGLDSKYKVLRENAIEFTNTIKSISKKTKQPIEKVARLFKVNRDWYYKNRPKKGCPVSPLKKCYHAHPFQLAIKEIGLIEKHMIDVQNKYRTKVTIFYYMSRKGLLYCSLSTFYKYAAFYRGNLKKDKRQKPTCSVKVTRPFEWIHIDIMHVQTVEDGLQKVAFVKDNFSKSILNYASTDAKAGSEFIRDLLDETYKKYKLFDSKYDINILSDGGPENKGLVLDWIKGLITPPIVRKVTANTDEFPFSNNMAESTHRIFKSEFLHGKLPLNKKDHIQKLEEFLEYYTNQRYPSDHYGLTVKEVLEGEVPDKNKYKEQRILARLNRYEENINFEDCPVMSQLPC